MRVLRGEACGLVDGAKDASRQDGFLLSWVFRRELGRKKKVGVEAVFVVPALQEGFSAQSHDGRPALGWLLTS